MIEQSQKKRAGRPRGVGPPIRQRPMVPIDRGEFGPHFAALPNARWREAALLRFETKSATDAVRLAGLGGTMPATARRQACRLFNDRRMLLALRELSERFVKSGTPTALRVIQQIMDDEAAPPRDRLVAAKVFVERELPTIAIVQQHAVVEHKYTNAIDEKVLTETLSTIALRFGIDRQKVLARPAVIDADYEEAS
jgi:hypothetical protein